MNHDQDHPVPYQHTFFLLRDLDLALADDVEGVAGRALAHDVRAAPEVALRKEEDPDFEEGDHADRSTKKNWGEGPCGRTAGSECMYFSACIYNST